jgi:hypothetical protein
LPGRLEEDYPCRSITDPISKFNKEHRMSDPKETPRNSPELTEDALSQVTGGADFLLQIDGIKGESQDDKHKAEIE